MTIELAVHNVVSARIERTAHSGFHTASLLLTTKAGQIIEVCAYSNEPLKVEDDGTVRRAASLDRVPA